MSCISEQKAIALSTLHGESWSTEPTLPTLSSLGVVQHPAYLLHHLLPFGYQLDEALDHPKPGPWRRFGRQLGAARRDGRENFKKEASNPCPPGSPHGPGDGPCLLGLLRGSPVVEEDEGAHGHGQVGPAHAGLAAEEQRRGGSAGVPQQEAGALLGGKEMERDGAGPRGPQRWCNDRHNKHSATKSTPSTLPGPGVAPFAPNPKELQKANPTTPNPCGAGAFTHLTLRKRMKASKCSSSGAPSAGRGRRW